MSKSDGMDSSSVNRPCYAHSHADYPRDPGKWQKLEEHLRGTAELAREFAEPFGAGEWAWNAGWLHDVGKATQAFQAYLARCNELDDAEYDSDGSVSNHASTGAAWGWSVCVSDSNIVSKVFPPRGGVD